MTSANQDGGARDGTGARLLDMLFDGARRWPDDESDPRQEAKGLNAGAAHYRAYVGPPNRFGFLSLSQTALLFALGLREEHNVLDVGCGSLRLGRMLLPFLAPGRYFGIEPNRWLVEEGVRRELGEDIVALKRPVFSDRDDFDCSAFGAKFEFIVAQSIITHAGPDCAARLFRTAAESLSPTGFFLLTYIPAKDGDPRPDEGWIYPKNLRYQDDLIAELMRAAGLHHAKIAWSHPELTWTAASKDAGQIEKTKGLEAFRGRPVVL